MRDNRSLYVFLSFMLLFTAMPQMVMAAFADVAEDAEAGLARAGEDAEGEAADAAAQAAGKDATALQQAMKKAVETGDIDTVKGLLKENPGLFKNEDTLIAKTHNVAVAKMQKAADEAANNLDSLTKDANESDDAFAARKGEAQKAHDAAQDALKQAKEARRVSGLSEDDARAEFAAANKAQVGAKRIAGTLKDMNKSAAAGMKQYANDVATMGVDELKAKYSASLENLEKTDGLIERINEGLPKDKQIDIADIRADFESGNAARIRAGALKVAKLKALDRAASAGAFAAKAGTEVEGILNKSIEDIDQSFDQLGTRMEDPKFTATEETITGADGTVTKVSELDQFIDGETRRLDNQVDTQVKQVSDKLDEEMLTLNKHSKVAGTLEKSSTFPGLRASGAAESIAAFRQTIRSATLTDVKDSILDGAGKVGSGIASIPSKLLAGAEMLVSAVMFMIPNIFQSAFLAQKQKVTELTSWALPIQFGGFVYQVPTSCININDPSSSWPVYVMIPVQNVGDPISATLATMYNDYIAGPTTNNALQDSIHSVSAQIFSFGTNSETSLSRYHLDPRYMLLSDISLVYGGVGAYVTTGSVALNSSDSTGNIMSIRTGAVVNAMGEMVNATGLDQYKAVPLINVTQWGGLQLPQTAPAAQGLQTVTASLPSLLAKFEVADTQSTYTQYQDIGSGSSGLGLSSIVRDVLDTSCVSEDGSLRSSDCQAAIVSGLEAIAAGINIVPGGISPIFKLDTLTPEQFLQINVPKTATESVTKLSSGAVSDSYGYNSSMGKTSVSVAVASNKSKKIGRLSKKTVSKSASNKSKRMGRLSAVAAAPASDDSTASVAPASLATLGMVIPVYGWGTSMYYSSIFASPDFEGFNPANVAGGSIVGATKLTTGESSQDATTDYAAMAWASHDTLWAAQGCWIYLATQTPFMQHLTQNQAPATPAFGDSLVDYVVFLDDSLNIIPMMAPVALTVTYTNDDGTTGTFKKVEMYVNPAIKYWTSLVAYNLPGFENVMYDLDGNAYADPNLANAIYVAAQGQAPSGFLGAISTAFPEIYNQFQVHSAALVDYFNRAPIKYKNCSLQVSPKYTLSLGGSSIETYTGLHAFNSNVSSLAIAIQSYPITSSVSFETLSSSTRGHFLIDLVTDIAYQLTNNSWIPVDFTHSPVTKAGVLQTGANKAQFYFLAGLYQGNIPANILKFATDQRKSWLSSLGSQNNATKSDGTELVGQCSFGTVQVGIRSADMEAQSYVYLNTTGGSSETAQMPRAMYVILTPNSSGGLTLSKYNSKAPKQYLLNLITGSVCDRNGQIVMVLPASQLEPMVKSWSGQWDSWLVSALTTLQADYQKRTDGYDQDEKNSNEYLQTIAEQNAQGQAASSDVVAIISRLKPLPVPYSTLEYDSTSGNYVHTSPASTTDATAKLYLFLSTGYVYQQDGSVASRYSPQHLKAVRDQYGVVVGADDKQTLGMPMLQPSMALDVEDGKGGDVNLSLTTSGTTMINLGVAGMYLGAPIVLPAGYGLFYNTVMGTYYILDSKKNRFLSIEGGYSYQLDGAPIRQNNTVAMAGAGDFMLLYKNAKNYYQAFMSDGSEYVNNSNTNTNATLTGLSSGTQYTMTTNKTFTQFTLQGATGSPKVYKVTNSYVWNSGALIPIDDNGALLTTIPSANYSSVEVVHDSTGAIAYLIFDGVLYQPSTASGAKAGSFVPANASAQGAIASLTVADGLMDQGTQVPYFTVSDGSTTYKYVCLPKTFDTAEQKVMRATIIRGSTAATPVAAKFGPMKTVTKEVGGKALQMSVPAFTTYTIFAADLPKTGAAITLTPVALSDITNMPTLTAEQSAMLQIGLGNIFKTGNNRFVCAIAGKNSTTPGMLSFPYVSNPAYVDLETAALYDQKTGVSLGLCLNLDDFITVLNSCQVKAVYDAAQQKEILIYKAPTAAPAPAPAATATAAAVASPVSTTKARVVAA